MKLETIVKWSRTATFAAILFAAGTLSADTWYVAADNYGKPGLDGKSEETAFGTIADAVTNRLLNIDDKVVVLPGVYSNGVITGTLGRSRVSIGKRIRLESRDGKEVTHIVGAPSPVTGTVGTNAVRCVCVTHLAGQTVVKGFTLRDGYTDSEARNGESSPFRGGAFFSNVANRSDSTVWLVDCVISNCVSRQANMFQGTAYRCWFTRNCSSDASGEAVSSSAWFHSCLITDNLTGPNKSGLYTMFGGRAVNCTFAGNDLANGVHGRNTPGYIRLYNTIVSAGEKMLIQNNALISANCSTNTDYQLIAPALGDFRVLAGGPADGTGDVAWLTDTEVGVRLPADEPLLDLNGNPYPSSGPIHMGAIQEAVEAKGKCLRINHYLSVEGQRVRSYDSYLYPTVYPKTYRVMPVYEDGADVLGYNIAPAERNWRFPESDGGLTVMPPSIGSTRAYLGVQPVKAARTVYVETPENGGSDTAGDGTAAAPFATIQKAVDSVTGSGAALQVIVSVGPGTYGEGEVHQPTNTTGTAVSTLGLASVTVIDKAIRIFGREGPERTILKGTPDPDYATADSLPGCGPQSGRCAIFSGDKCNGIQGFTLTGGYAARDSVSGASPDYGGAWIANAGRAVIADCIISNNVAHMYGAGAGGQMIRCFVADNRSTTGTVGGGGATMAAACVFRDDPSACGTYGTLGLDCWAWHCTIVGATSSALAVRNGTTSYLFNSIVHGGAAIGSSSKIGGVLAWGVEGNKSAGVEIGNPLFVDLNGGDLRVKSYSPATSRGRQTDSVFYQYMSTDFTGTPLDFTDGWPAVGAFQETVSSRNEVYVEAENGGVAVAGGDVGDNTLAEGVISLSPTNGPRPCIGYVVNGATNLLTALPGGTVELTAAQAADGIYVKTIYDSNWYVDAANGDDESPGFSIMPKKTLAATMALAASGDVVHAAPGDYNQGQMGQNDTCMISSRVVVASGVVLKADQGPDVTFISGANATINPVASGNYAGCGTNALRCVYLKTNARVEGFTVRNGRYNGLSPDNVNTRSGGVYGESTANSIAYGCVITNCWGYRGGGCYGIVAVNCRFIDNRSQDGTAGKCAALYGCHLGRGYFSNAISNPRGTGIVNCTFEDNNMSTLTGSGKNNAVSYSEAKYPFRNCLILCKFGASATNPVVLENCVLLTNRYSETAAPYVTMTDCLETNLEAIAIGADGRLSAESVAIDFGDNAKVVGDLGGKDVVGGQRIYNGSVDAGAYEYDWRGIYAKTLHPMFCEVDEASPEVVQGEGKVLVTGTLRATYAGSADWRKCSFAVPVQVTGGGVLTVSLNGETAAEYVAADGAQTFAFKNTNAFNEVSFMYAAVENDVGAAEIGEALRRIKGSVVVVR